MIYGLGFLLVLAARIVYAGVKTDELFYRAPKSYEITLGERKKTDRVINGEKVFFYVAITMGLSISWPILLPALGLFKLGQKYASNSRK